MTPKDGVKGPESKNHFVWRVGVMRWGIPVGAITALATFADKFGLSWHTVLSVNFLACIVIFVGSASVFGYGFGLVMWMLRSQTDDK